MRLYHRHFFFMLLAAVLLGLPACAAPTATQAMVRVQVAADGDLTPLVLPAGSTVEAALAQLEISLGPLDRVEPPDYTLLSDGAEVRVVRVTEEFSIEQEVIPFERQLLQTESLADQERLLAQNGVNGLRETTYRHVYEDGVLVSSSPVRTTVLQQPIPEIVMVGVQAPFQPVQLPGKLAYLLGSNAWIMQGDTTNRTPVVTTGDLDGRIFTLSEDASWLLFTRRSKEEGQINSLWAADLRSDPPQLYDLKVANVVHFAGWVPNSGNDEVVFSTVEPRQTAPGWQANNDLSTLTFSSSGWTSRWKVYVDANSGGVYGWWGTQFAWEPGGERVAYARADEIGLVNMETGSFERLAPVVPLKTGGDWAWAPSIVWSPDSQFIFSVDHAAPANAPDPEASPVFDLAAVPVGGGSALRLAQQTGMFAYPAVSPVQERASGEQAYQVAYLQAIFPNQSESSRYRLVVMDRDGSNRREIFPRADQPGLDPQQAVWSPAAMPDSQVHALAVLYQGNLWLVDAGGEFLQRQITGDGLVSRIDWKPTTQSSGN
jgi:hypothetical protein